MSIVTIGEVVVDWLATPGETLLSAHEFYRDLGGNASNTAIGLSRLGNHVYLIGKIGADFHGQFLRRVLEAEKIDLKYLIIDSRYPTAQCYVITNNNGDHQYSNWPRPHAADMLEKEEVSEEALRQSTFLHATGISLMKEPRRTAVREAFSLAEKHGTIINFDGSFPTGAGMEAKEHVEDLLGRAHLLKLNKHEARFWSGAEADDNIEDVCSTLFNKYKPVALMLTMSAAGSLIMTAGGLIHCPPISVEAVSEVGAGDAYVAGILHALNAAQVKNLNDLRDLSATVWKEAGRAGNICGALVTRSVSAYNSLPLVDEFNATAGQLALF